MTELEKVLNEKLTENGDLTYSSTGNNLLDLLFMTEYYQKHLNEVKIGESDIEKIFSMFIRDPRYGLGRRDLGRELMKQSNVPSPLVAMAGRFDDLIKNPTMPNLNYILSEIMNGNELAKKWMPRLTGKDRKLAKAFCKQFNMTEKEYRAFIKCDTTTEYKLSYAEKQEGTPLNELFNNNEYTHPLVDKINFEHVPSLAMIKYYNLFKTRDDLKDRFQEYLDSVKKGAKKLNVATTTCYDIYKNRHTIDADLFFDKLEKIKISCIPILDTSGSMHDNNDSFGKAESIAHYLAKCSTYANNQIISFSSEPRLMTIKGDNYMQEIGSMYTGDCSDTDFASVMEILKGLKEFPEYLIVLSDMEFNYGSMQSKNELEQLWKDNNCNTKIIWWNFNSRNTTAPETDDMGNIFLSGYNPMLLKFLESGFDGNAFLKKLLVEYTKNIDNNN